MGSTPKFSYVTFAEAQAGAQVFLNENTIGMENGVAALSIKDRDLATAPSSPADGDVYIISGTPAGDWATATNKTAVDGDIAVYFQGWIFYSPANGLVAFVEDEKLWIAYSSSWHLFGTGEYPATKTWTGAMSGANFCVRKRLSVTGPAAGTAAAPIYVSATHGISNIDWTLPFKVAASAVKASEGIHVPSVVAFTWTELIYNDTQVAVGSTGLDLSSYTVFLDVECYVTSL